jgi:hypothetical protein
MTDFPNTPREVAERESSELQRRLRDAEYQSALRDRTAQGIAPHSATKLHGMFFSEPAKAWGLLRGMDENDLVLTAIEYADYLEIQHNSRVDWVAILDYWKSRLMENPTKG